MPFLGGENTGSTGKIGVFSEFGIDYDRWE